MISQRIQKAHPDQLSQVESEVLKSCIHIQTDDVHYNKSLLSLHEFATEKSDKCSEQISFPFILISQWRRKNMHFHSICIFSMLFYSNAGLME